MLVDEYDPPETQTMQIRNHDERIHKAKQSTMTKIGV